jgi:hypothetical protein
LTAPITTARSAESALVHEIGTASAALDAIATGAIDTALSRDPPAEPRVYPCCDNPACPLCRGSGIATGPAAEAVLLDAERLAERAAKSVGLHVGIGKPS